MSCTRRVIGIDISTQTVTAMLIEVEEKDGRPAGLVVSDTWIERRTCRDETSRRNPAVWLELVRDCIAGLKTSARQAATAESIGVSTTFPGCLAVFEDGLIDPQFVSLYDNSDDAGVCTEDFEPALALAERETLNRIWPGSMAVGLAHLVKSKRLRLDRVRRIVPPNTAVACQLFREAGCPPDSSALFSDFTQTTVSGLYDARSGEPVPKHVGELLLRAAPGIDLNRVKTLLPNAAPAWRNVIPAGDLGAVRRLLGLPELVSVSIGAGDSALGTLALLGDRQTIINVRGSSDSPTMLVDAPKPCTGGRETVLHFPLPTATRLGDAPWCVVAPMLRSGRVWDWVRNLRFAADDPDADAKLEALAREAFHVKHDRPPLQFDTALGGERAPSWDAGAVGSIVGLVESHGIGDIALAALEGMSNRLAECIKLMESRYEVSTSKLVLAGGPARNDLWNAVTKARTGKQTYATTFADASLLGAALLGYAALYDGLQRDHRVSERLLALSRLSATHPCVAPRELSSL